MLHNRLLEVIALHVELLDRMRNQGINYDDIINLYAVLHALQVHAQAIIDYLLYTCALMGISSETPIHCIDELSRTGLISNDNADLLRRIVRFRNIVVHEYGAIDIERVRGIVESRFMALPLILLGIFTVSCGVWALLIHDFCIVLFLYLFFTSHFV